MRKMILMYAVLILAACGQRVKDPVVSDRLPEIFPDYVGVTVPAGIAPLDFAMGDDDVERIDVTVRGEKGGEIHAAGAYADFEISDWSELTQKNVGADPIVTV